MKLKQILTGVIILFVSPDAGAQKKVAVTFEEVKSQCQDIPLDQRLRIKVARFNVSAPRSTSELGQNMATMLSNALAEVNCFDVIASLKDNDDHMDEIDFGKSEYADKKKTAQKGKMMGSQVTVIGEITEYGYNTSSKGTSSWPVSVTSSRQTLKLGFIMQLKNTETGQILFSKSVNVTGTSSGGTSIRVKWYSQGNGADNQAEVDALEKGILQAVQLIVTEKGRIERAVAGSSQSATAAGGETIITIRNADYDVLSDFGNMLKVLPRVKATDPTLEEGIASFRVQHTGLSGELLEDLKPKISARYKVTGLKEGEIKMITK